ncbi:hypothetical protein [Ensifer sp. LC54]|uniref:hypothetical protein n=1 Tax=Ensifer sp. LC54 TaxID=1873715 RepID=UPI000812C126|nr:hypothetical protein [Ensifer sp. LC54]OCP21961.1 hypothetical protein BC361_25675 [Ensifer sp. LC54]OCP23259.1 hypothetical protein BC363_25090 [Ensifer sp. LC384]
MKKKQHRQRPNQKKAREKQPQRVASALSSDKWAARQRSTDALHHASMAAALGSAMAAASMMRRFDR